MRPMLATRADRVPPGGEWLHEVKWDGVRAVVEVAGPDEVRVLTRNGRDAALAYPEVAGPLGPAVPAGTVLDGEVVAFDGGVPSFSRLADRMHVRSARRAAELARTNPVTHIAFDLLRLGAEDLCDLPLEERRARLEGLGLDGAGASTHVAPAYDDGVVLLEATRAQGLEGVVSKRRGSRYRPGVRSKDWLKLPHRATASYVVGGWRPETGSSDRVGALLVGTPGPDGLAYKGRVGSGVAGRTGSVLARLLAPRAAGADPFAEPVPRVDAVGTRWVEPTLVVEVAALGLTGGGRLRQPSLVGIREDLDPADVAAQEAP